MSEKCLLDQWRDMAYDQTQSRDHLEKFWASYFNIEKEIYEQLLEEPDTEVKGTVRELAEKYGIFQAPTLVAVADGIMQKFSGASNIRKFAEQNREAAYERQ